MKIAAPLNSGLRPKLQRLELAAFFQIPGFQIVGLPSREIAEARERVRAAIEASGLEFPKKRLVLNLSPADVQKRGTGVDLAIALEICKCALNDAPKLSKKSPDNLLAVAWGELGLDGRVKPVGQITRALYAAWMERAHLLILPQATAGEALAACELIKKSGRFGHRAPRLAFVENLSEAVAALQIESTDSVDKTIASPALECPKSTELPPPPLLPLSPSLERAMLVSTTGRHHLLLLGPRGVGKSQAIEWVAQLQAILPNSPSQALDRMLLAELSPSPGNPGLPTFRRVGPHVRPPALLGSISSAGVLPGEFTLAHGGFLVADEFPEWARDSRECLREPLERGKVMVTRVRQSEELPARFTFIGTGNYCPCGGLPREIPMPEGKRTSACECTAGVRQAYWNRLSGPVMDRIDVLAQLTHWHQPPANRLPDGAATWARLSDHIRGAQARLLERYGKLPGEMDGIETEIIIREHATLGTALETGTENPRSRHKLARIALTLAALSPREELPGPAHVAEARYHRMRPLSERRDLR
ncbi:MAG: ATP-binding protein [Bacteriovoracia bacterium]